MKQSGEVWVFAYGSLMWDPGFADLEAAPALLRGYHRAFCIYSHVYRGTEAHPGQVQGLERGGACRGMAYRIAAAKRAGVLDYLDAREKVTDVYLRRTVPIAVGGLPITVGGLKVKAETYVADRGHYQYAGKQTLKAASALIAQGTGTGGSNRDYLESTVNHLDELGITDGALHRLHAMVRGMGEGK